uniref:aldehyde dehydrogenase family protein n=1 Tax=Rhizorhabdus wittichii TaxID=160791 RepID=UPI00037B03D7
KVALELGGKSANILLDDADLSVAVPQAIGQCFVNGGQTCAALTRLIAPRAKRAEVEALAMEAAAQWRPGDPEQPSTRLGPLSSLRQRERVAAMVARALEGGATALIGGTAAPEGFEKGAWFAATVLSGVTPEMEIAREEVFGPVLVILDHDGEEDAIAIANDSAYGLSGGVWSADPARAERVAARLRTGQVMINGAMLDMEAPFGGVGQSGIGREYGRYGLEEYFNLKAITGTASAGQDRGSNE